MPSWDPLVTNLRGLAPTDFIFKVENFTYALEAHPVFSLSPEHVPGFATIRDWLAQYKVAVVEAEKGGTDRKAQRDDLREKIQQGVEIQGQHMVMVALHRKDMSLLDTVGLDQKHHSYPKNTRVWNPSDLPRITVSRGHETRTALVTVSKINGAPGIQLQHSTGDPADESSYIDLGPFPDHRIRLADLETLKNHHFRARYIRGTVVGPWSQIVSVVII